MRHDGTEQLIRARRGVVLTAGGFIQNAEMIRRHSPLLDKVSFRLGVDGDDGRAIRMAMGAGADVTRMHAGEVAIPITPPRRLVRGILVTPAGQRFINEDAYYGRIGQEGLFRHGGRMFLILDTAVYERNNAGFEAHYVEETIADLERVIGMPEAACSAPSRSTTSTPPPATIPFSTSTHSSCSPSRKRPTPPSTAAPTRSCGRASPSAVSAPHPRSEVLTPDGAVIPGLYAAGRTTSGIAVEGYVSGISLGDGTFFGRAAGRSAAIASSLRASGGNSS